MIEKIELENMKIFFSNKEAETARTVVKTFGQSAMSASSGSSGLG